MQRKELKTLSENESIGETQSVSLYFEVILYLCCIALFTIPPLFFLGIEKNEWVSGFIPIRMVNAELKFCVIIIFISLIIGMIGIRVSLKGNFLPYPKSFLFFGGLFLLSILVSTSTAHNFTRAWVSSFTWHILPLVLALSFTQLKWNANRLKLCLFAILIGGVLSSLIVMDQHYQWTDWSHRLPRLGFGGLIYNQNFAAEYHAPLLPLALGLLFYVQSRIIKLFIFVIIALTLLPALSLSLARGAWLGMIAACLITGISYVLLIFIKRTTIETHKIKSFGFIPFSFLILGLVLPLYLYTSDYWKKGAFPENHPSGISSTSSEAKELKSITTITDAYGGSGRRLVLWQDALKASLSNDFFWGKGTDHYELHFHKSAKLSDKTTGGTLVRFVHNDFLQILYENGIIGLIGFLGLWVVVFWRARLAVISCLKSGDSSTVGLILGLSASCLTFLIESFFEFPTRSPCALIVGWASFGLLLTISLHKHNHKSIPISKTINPKLNLLLGATAIFVIPYGCILSKNLFWANIYHFQGRIAGDYGEKDKSLKFHRESIAYSPWEHHSRKWECYYLLTHKRQFPEALEAINKTLEVHPGCLVAHQNKIAVSLNELRDQKKALQAYREMEKAAPFHLFTLQESLKFSQLTK